MNRISPNQTPAPRPASPSDSADPSAARSRGHRGNERKDLLVFGSNLGTSVLLFIVALLVAAVVWLIYSAAPAAQSKFIDPNKLQAVFLNTGQVYFGNVQAINKDYVVLANVYYLQTSGTSGTATQTQSNQNVSLVKLGCELHMPYDRMIVNTSQVTFWENLQSNGQVAKAVSQYQKANPSGQKCADQSQAGNAQPNLQNQNNTGTNAPAKK